MLRGVHDESSRRFGLSLVLSAAVISGVATFVNTFAVAGTGSTAWTGTDAFVTVRNGLVTLLMVPLFVWGWRFKAHRLHSLDWARLAAIGLVGGAVPFLLFFRGLQIGFADGGSEGRLTASFLFRTLFLMAGVLAVVVLRERLSWRLGAATMALLGGNVLLASLRNPIWTDGALLVLTATALWSVEYTVSKHVMRHLPATTVAFGRMAFGAAFLATYLLASGQFAAVTAFSATQVAWIVVSAALLLGFVTAWYSGLRRVDLSLATAVLVLGFPVTWVLSTVASVAPFGIPQAAGAAIVAFGVVLAIGLTAFRDTLLSGLRFLARRGATR